MKNMADTEAFLRIQLLREQIETLKVERALKLKAAGFKYDESILERMTNPSYGTYVNLVTHDHLVMNPITKRWEPLFGFPEDYPEKEPPPMSFSETDHSPSPTEALCNCTSCMNTRSW